MLVEPLATALVVRSAKALAGPMATPTEVGTGRWLVLEWAASSAALLGNGLGRALVERSVERWAASSVKDLEHALVERSVGRWAQTWVRASAAVPGSLWAEPKAELRAAEKARP